MKSEKKGTELFEMWLGCGLYVHHFVIESKICKICTLSERLLAFAMKVHTCSTCSWNNDKIPKS